MGTPRFIPLVALVAATVAWGEVPTADESIVGEVLQVEITVEPERIGRHIQGSEGWVAVAPSRPRPVEAPFPGVPIPAGAAAAEPPPEPQ